MDKYRKVKLLCESASSRVYLAESLTTHNFVTMKECIVVGSNKETRILETLSHPNIVKFLEAFPIAVGSNSHCIVTEYCEGGDLASYSRRRPLNSDQIREVFIQLLLALKHLHDRNIIHRDLKLCNVMVCSQSPGILRVKIGDFGISKQLEASLMTSTLVGTPYYLSPELCAQRPYDKSVDIWALGCLIYELVSDGRHPFNAKLFNELITNIQEHQVDFDAIRDEKFIALLRLMLRKDNRQRPSVDDLLYNPIVQEFIQQFVERISSNHDNQQLRPHVAQQSSMPTPISNTFNLSSTTELLKTMKSVFPAKTKTETSTLIEQQLRLAASFDSEAADEPVKLEFEAEKLKKQLAKYLFLPSRLNDFLKLITTSQSSSQIHYNLQKLGFTEDSIREMLDSGLFADAVVIFKKLK